MMRLSCCAYSYRQALQGGQMTLFDFLRVCRDLDMDGVELTAYYFPTTERDYLESVKQEARSLGLAVSGTAVGSDFAQPDAEKRREHVAMTKAWIEHSVTLGAPTLRVFAGGVREGQSEEEAFGNVVACLQECAGPAAERGIKLALENHGGLTATAEGTLRLLQAVDRPAVGLNLDFGNFTGDIYAQFAACAPYAVATHAKKSARSASGPVPVDYRQVGRIMDAAGYRGFLAIEYEEEEPAETGVPVFASELRAIFPATRR
ncbi:MAG TPA: sugar phosphate isomerase/epimerase family protein [Chthonomonadaceae bacterium]|nr:sugar phosphate isomerase/epimerase family protein [Chthonomonadaceae bacterium]